MPKQSFGHARPKVGIRCSIPHVRDRTKPYNTSSNLFSSVLPALPSPKWLHARLPSPKWLHAGRRFAMAGGARPVYEFVLSRLLITTDDIIQPNIAGMYEIVPTIDFLPSSFLIFTIDPLANGSGENTTLKPERRPNFCKRLRI